MPALDEMAGQDVGAIKRQLARALQEIGDQKQLREQEAAEHQSALLKLSSQIEDQNGKIERLERHRAALMLRGKTTEDRQRESADEVEKYRSEMQTQTTELRRSLSELEQKYAEATSASRQARHELESARASAEARSVQTTELEQEVATLQQLLSYREKLLQVEKTERRAAELRLEERTKGGGDHSQENLQLIKDELHRLDGYLGQVTHLRSLEHENAKLRRRLETYERQHSEFEVLRESNKSMEKRIRLLNELRGVNITQEAKIHQLEREKLEWMAFIEDNADMGLSSPRQVTKRLASLQIQNALQQETLSAHASELKRRNEIISDLEADVTNLQDALREERKKTGRSHEQIERDQKQVTLLQKEVAMLRNHLNSYTAEEAVHHVDFDSQKTTRLAELEDLLDAHKRDLAEITKQATYLQGLVERYGGSTTEMMEREDSIVDSPARAPHSTTAEQLRINEELRDELEEARASKALLEKELDALELQVAKLEEDHGVRGAYNHSTTMVLEFEDSPDRKEHAIRSATLERLRSENGDLLARLAELDRASLSARGTAVALVPRASLETAQADLLAARAAVVQKETMLKRISQAVAEKTEGMRIAISQLLGYQLSFLDSGRIRVTSVYAPSKDRSLAFDLWPGGPMPYRLASAADDKVLKSTDVRESVKFWLDSRSSLPGFFASLTMTLYEETTRGAAGGVIVG
ncbi:coiled-coil domain-containing protein mad1 [Microbotryomycetes sp. JL221]|nr:coiled-coil domain-containing protein mad1 [Microbotryomycetes sp. JL221]